jgi:peptidase S24-like protein
MQNESRTVKISGERLAELWRGSMMSKESFAQAAGMKRSGVFRLMRPGVHGMFADNFRKIAEVLKTTPDDLHCRVAPDAFGTDDESRSPCGVSGPAHALSHVPSYHSISAGARSERLGIETGNVKVPVGLCDFCVRVDGESMIPTYPDRATALFENVEGHEFVFGKDYIIWFTNDECYFSRVFESDDDRDLLVLRKLNPDRSRFPDRMVHRREIERVAHCVGVLTLTK